MKFHLWFDSGDRVLFSKEAIPFSRDNPLAGLVGRSHSDYSGKIELLDVYSNQLIMEVTLNQHIEITPGVRGGKPRIAGTRMTVADIATLYLRMGQSLDLIAGKYHLPLASVYAAMAYYYDHRDEIGIFSISLGALARIEGTNKQGSLRRVRPDFHCGGQWLIK
jgi:uncharacterized protein (DUF433 family)